jgi:mannose-6-phosphate isomerase-like protein (cupin superfamily)
MPHTATPFAVARGQGELFGWSGVEFEVLASGEQTGGGWSLLTDRSDAMTINWHVHEDDEVFYVLEGRYRLRCGEETFEVGPGGLVFLPRGIPHEQTVLEDGSRKLVLLMPGGFERFFREMSVAINEGALTPERRADIAARHGIRWLSGSA